MAAKSNRRQWLLTLVGTVFGARAASAADRLLPGKNHETAGMKLSLTTLHANGRTTQTEAVAGRVVVEYDGRSGLIHLSRYDAKGRLFHTQDGVAEVSLSRVSEAPADGTRPSGHEEMYFGSTFTYTYDANGDKREG